MSPPAAATAPAAAPASAATTVAAAGGSSRRPRLDRKRLYALHGWLGLNLGILLWLVCISGTLAVFTPEIDRFIDPVRRITPPPAAPAPAELARSPDAWAAWHAAVQTSHPAANIAYLAAPAHPRDPAVAYISYDEADTRRVFIDPHTAAILGDRPYLDAKSFVRVYHKQFHLVASTVGFHGTWIVGAFALVLLGASVTGLLAFPRWWRALYTLRFFAAPRVLWSDLHRALGAWALLVTLVIALTGIWYWGERAFHDFGLAQHDPARAVLPERAETAPPLPFVEQLARAFAAYPALIPATVQPSSRLDRPLFVHGQAEALAVGDRANHVALDPVSGEVVRLARAIDLAPFDRVALSIDPLHFGTFGGFATRVVWFVAGLALSLGILGGAVLYAVRTARRASAGPLARSRAWWISTAFTLLVIATSAWSAVNFIGDGQLPAVPASDSTRPVPGQISTGVSAFVVATLILYFAPVAVWLRVLRW